jgi:hypothetical protein
MTWGHIVGGVNNTNLCNPLIDNRGLPNVQPVFAQGHFHGAIDWTSGTAGLSANSVLNQSAAMSTGIMSGMAAFGSIKDGPYVSRRRIVKSRSSALHITVQAGESIYRCR